MALHLPALGLHLFDNKEHLLHLLCQDLFETNLIFSFCAGLKIIVLDQEGWNSEGHLKAVF